MLASPHGMTLIDNQPSPVDSQERTRSSRRISDHIRANDFAILLLKLVCEASILPFICESLCCCDNNREEAKEAFVR